MFALICTATQQTRPQARQAIRVPQPDNGFGCEMCKFLVGYIDTLMESETIETDIVKAIDGLCEKLPSPYSSLCDQLAEQYIHVILKWLEDELTVLDVCSKIGLCPKPSRMVALPAIDNGFGCDMCKSLVEYVEQLVESETTQAKIIELCDKLCEKLPSPYGPICNTLVATYIPKIIEWLTQELTSLDICSKIGLCTKAQGALYLPAEDNGFGCDMCKQLIDYVEKLIDSETTQEKIIELCQKLCAKFPSPYGVLCNTLVATYIPKVIKWLEDELTALDICSKIGLCAPKAFIALPAADNGFGCDMCKSLVDYVEKLLESETTQAKIIELCDKLCEKLPSPYGALCNSLVASYIPKIVEWIEQELTSLDICTKIGLCTAAMRPKIVARMPRLEEQPVDGVSCDICKDFVEWIKSEVTEYSVPAIWKLVSEECPKVPYLRTICKLINENNIENLVNALLSYLPAQQVCGWIKLC